MEVSREKHVYVSSAKWKNLDGPVSRTRPSISPFPANSLPTASNFAIFTTCNLRSEPTIPALDLDKTLLFILPSRKGGIKKLRIASHLPSDETPQRGRPSHVIKQRFVISNVLIKRAATHFPLSFYPRSCRVTTSTHVPFPRRSQRCTFETALLRPLEDFEDFSLRDFCSGIRIRAVDLR